mgnify:CR=1 FL=1
MFAKWGTVSRTNGAFAKRARAGTCVVNKMWYNFIVKQIEKFSKKMGICGFFLVIGLFFVWTPIFSALDSKAFIFLERAANKNRTLNISPSLLLTMQEEANFKTANDAILSLTTLKTNILVLDIAEAAFVQEANDSSTEIISRIVPIPQKIQEKLQLNLSPPQKEILNANVLYPQAKSTEKFPKAEYFSLPPLASIGEKVTLAFSPQEQKSPVVRTPLFCAYEGGFIPSLAMAAAIKTLGLSADDIEICGGKYVRLFLLDGQILEIPIDDSGCVIFSDIPQYSLTKLRAENVAGAAQNYGVFKQLAGICAGKTILFGDGNSVRDTFTKTALNDHNSEVWVQAAVLNGILEDGAFFKPTPIFLKLVLTALAVCAMIIAVFSDKTLLFHLIPSVCVILLAGMNFLLYKKFNIMIWFFGLLFYIFFCWLTTFLTQHLVVKWKKRGLK